MLRRDYVPRRAVRSLRDDAAVSGLKPNGQPLAVTRAIVSVHVIPLNGQVGVVPVRFSPCLERLKRGPLGANRDAPGSVVLIRRDVRISASIEHVGPNAIEASAEAAMSPRDAAAGGGQPSPEAWPLDSPLAAAVASAVPPRISFSWRAREHRPSSKSRPTEVDQLSTRGRRVTRVFGAWHE